jgi:hypothetical protein
MDRYSDAVLNENGRVVPGASIQIIDQCTGQLAMLYASRDGEPLENPLTTDLLGRWSFCAADGLYTAKVYLGGVLKVTVPDIRLEDPTDGIASFAEPSGAARIGSATGTVQGDISNLQSTVAGLHNYELTPATPGALGGVIVGDGLAITPEGKLSATGLTKGTVATVNAVAPDGFGNVNLNTDNLPEGGNNQWFTMARVRNAVLTGLLTSTSAIISATDTVLAALGKLQAQISSNTSAINANTSAIAGKQDANQKDATGGYAGLTGFAINVKNAAGTVVSKLSSAATIARSIVLPDKDGTVALMSDIPAAGALILLDQKTVTAAATIDFLNVFTSAYDKYVIELTNYQSGTTAQPCLQAAVGGVVQSGANYTQLLSMSATASSASSSSVLLSGSAHSNLQAHPGLTIEVNNVNGAGTMKTIGVRGLFVNSTSNYEGVAGTAAFNMTNTLSGFRLLWTGGGQFTKATVRVYGIKNS